MKKRKVDEIHYCEWTARKRAIVTRQKGSIYHGIKFEYAWAKYMDAKQSTKFNAGPWIEYSDINGLGYCQPDGILWTEEQIIVFECKLTFTYRKAYNEMRDLYAPLLEHMYE